MDKPFEANDLLLFLRKLESVPKHQRGEYAEKFALSCSHDDALLETLVNNRFVILSQSATIKTDFTRGYEIALNRRMWRLVECLITNEGRAKIVQLEHDNYPNRIDGFFQ